MSDSCSIEAKYGIGNIEASIMQAASACGEPLTLHTYEDWRVESESGYPSASHICQVLSWGAACERVDVQYGDRGAASRWSEDDLLSAIKQAQDNLGGSLTCDEYDQWRDTVDKTYPSSETVVKRIGWTDACERVDIPYGNNTQYTTDDIHTALNAAAESCGEPLRIADYREWRSDIDGDYPAQSRISHRVGWAAACEGAGVRSTGMGGWDYKRSDIKAAIQMAATASGEPLTPENYHQWRKNVDTVHPPAIMISNRVGWDGACDLAGVTTEGDRDGK